MAARPILPVKAGSRLLGVVLASPFASGCKLPLDAELAIVALVLASMLLPVSGSGGSGSGRTTEPRLMFALGPDDIVAYGLWGTCDCLDPVLDDSCWYASVGLSRRVVSQRRLLNPDCRLFGVMGVGVGSRFAICRRLPLELDLAANVLVLIAVLVRLAESGGSGSGGIIEARLLCVLMPDDAVPYCL